MAEEIDRKGEDGKSSRGTMHSISGGERETETGDVSDLIEIASRTAIS